jgi:hypothetical protein
MVPGRGQFCVKQSKSLQSSRSFELNGCLWPAATGHATISTATADGGTSRSQARRCMIEKSLAPSASIALTLSGQALVGTMDQHRIVLVESKFHLAAA